MPNRPAAVVNAATMTVLQTLPVEHHPIGITYDAATRRVWVSSYSGGMRRRLNLGCALVSKPRLILLDDQHHRHLGLQLVHHHHIHHHLHLR